MCILFDRYLYLVADGKGVQELSVNTRDATSILNCKGSFNGPHFVCEIAC